MLNRVREIVIGGLATRSTLWRIGSFPLVPVGAAGAAAGVTVPARSIALPARVVIIDRIVAG